MAKRFFSQLLDRCEAKAEQLKSRWAGLSDHGQVGVCLAGVTGVLALWALFWPVPTEVKGQGVLIFPSKAGLLNARAQGQVLAVNVKVGDRVKKGQELMSLYLPVLERELAQQRGNLLQLEAINGELNERDARRLETEKAAVDVALAKFDDDLDRYSRLQATYGNKLNNLEWLSSRQVVAPLSREVVSA
ncbi:MAG: biotin/lipoyl-binding protein, partial [Synechococcus sp.]